MDSGLDLPITPGFRQTCWRGLSLCHPMDWEPAYLAGPAEKAKCVLADRRFQRLQLVWEVLGRTPDLEAMFDRLGRGDRSRTSRPWGGVPGWRGLMRQEQEGSIVKAGRFFEKGRLLVQAILVWPEGRDKEVERDVLASVAPLPGGETVRWEALGLLADVPVAYELAHVSSKVGHVAWEFRKPGRGGAGLSMERIAMPGQWLKTPIREWVGGNLPKGYRSLRDLPVTCGPHRGTEVHSVRGNLLTSLTRGGMRRTDRAWLCENEKRVYRLACWRRASAEIDMPGGLGVRCCQSTAGMR